MNWVQNGGHLVCQVADTNVLLRQLDVHLRNHIVDSINDKGEISPTTQKIKNGLRPVDITGEGRLQADIFPYSFLQAGRVSPIWSVHDVNGFHALRFRVGSGYVTVVSDWDWAHNAELATGDHGALFWRLVDTRPLAIFQRSRHSEAPQVWLITNQDYPSLLQLLWQNIGALLVAALIFVAVWLWQAMQRFGPVRSVLPAQRHRLGEHLEASGRYLLQQHALDRLFEASRQRLLAHAQRRHPQWRSLPAETLAQEMARHSGIEPDAILSLLTQTAPAQPLPFATAIRLINRLRKTL